MINQQRKKEGQENLNKAMKRKRALLVDFLHISLYFVNINLNL